MTRSRGRAAPPRPAPTGLPALAQQTQIAQAVHQAICDLTQTDGAQCCALYAAMAANCMPHLTGAKYTINSGTLTVATQPGGDGFQFNAANPLIPDAEFHALLVRDHGDGRFAVADLASRHWRVWAERLGAGWDAPPPPVFVWCWADDLPAAWPLGIAFAADLALTERHLAWVHGAGAPLIRQASGQALRLLGHGPRSGA